MPTDTVPTHDCDFADAQVLRSFAGEFGPTTVYCCNGCDREMEVHEWSFPETV